ncbi:MAG: hypothetical protein AAGC80_31120, partial [Rhodococcus sp. (in: high G+C Gram-positive bacteria)]
AQRLLVTTQLAAGHEDEATALLVECAHQCASLQMFRYLVDGGPFVQELLQKLRNDKTSTRQSPISPAVLNTMLKPTPIYQL